MVTIDDVRELIQQGIPDATVQVVDLTGTSDHFRATVRSKQFEGLSRIDQHRMVYAAVADQLDSGEIHALSIDARVGD